MFLFLTLEMGGCPGGPGPSDTTAPIVTSTVPADGGSDVPIKTAIVATFSEAMASESLTTSSFALAAGGSPVAGTVQTSGTTATLSPSADLAANTAYTATITTAVTDLAGNHLAADFVWTFTTGAAPDTTAPKVLSVSPADSAEDVLDGSSVSATFSEPMDPASLTATTFRVTTAGAVAGSVAYSGTTATFTPAAGPLAGGPCTATITTGAKDLAGNPLAANYTWHFSILVKPDLYVTPGGVNNTFALIGDALAAAQPGDLIGVAAGIYTENVVIGKTVTLKGGWNLAFDAVDPAAYVTTIQPLNPAVAVVTVAGQAGNTAAVTPTIQGFTITGAVSANHGGGLRIQNSDAKVRRNTIRRNTAFLLGGGIWVQNGAPRLEGNQILDNTVTTGGSTAGAGINLENTKATLIGNIIDGNAAMTTVGYGGGIAIQGGGPVTLTDNTITNNAAANQASTVKTDFSYGGGISVQNASVTMTRNLVQRNTANSAADNARGFGGGVYISGSAAFTLTGNTIDQNTGGFAQVSPYLLGGGILIDASQGKLVDNVISTNRANRYTIFGNGGGLAVVASTVVLRGGRISDNTVSRNFEGYGGGLYAKGSTVACDGTLVQNNGAGNTPYYGMGGGMAFIDSPFTVTNAIIVDNYAYGNDSADGGIFAGVKTTNPNSAGDITSNNSPGVLVNNTIANNNGHAVNIAAPTTLVNNIIAGKGNATGIKLTGSGPVTAVYNDFYNNAANVAGFPFDISNIVINPQLTTDFHLMANSPVIDAGTHGPIPKAGSATGETVGAPVTDFDGQPRPMIGSSGLYRVDMGADEFTGAAQRIVDLDTTGADLTVVGPGGDPNLTQNAPTNDWIGYSVLAADVNGDGKADLVTSAEDFAVDPNNAPFTPGRLFGLVNFGQRKTGTIDLLNTPADLTIDDRLTLQHIGSALASGDLNGDGKNDLFAGSYQDDGAGGGAVWPTVFVFYGGSSLAGTRLLDAAHPAGFALRAPGQDFFAFAAKNALTTGDLNADGKTDLIVGDGKANDGATAGTGAVFVIFGGPGLSGLHDLGATAANYTLYGPAAAAGLQSCEVGRLNADAQNDLVARTGSTAHVIFGPIGAGARHLGAAPADIIVTGLGPGGVAVMDLTGDGQDDLLLGSNDKLYVIPGPLAAGTHGINTYMNRITLTGSAPDAVLAVGDVVGDSRPDLIVGSATLKRAFAIAGGTALSGSVALSDAAATIVESTTIKNLGKDVAAGDLDNDGRPDLIVGSFFQDVGSHAPGFQDAGTVYVIYGR